MQSAKQTIFKMTEDSVVNKKRRFPDLEIDEIDPVKTEKDSENTRKGTKTSVNIFKRKA